MPKEWILNMAFNRWQLNRPRYVGRLAEAIRACAPKTEKEWEQYYFREVPRKHVPKDWKQLGNTMEDHLREIGRRLYAKVSEQLRAEIDEVTEEDCVAYVRDVVIRRTYEGYVTEKRTVYEQLEQALGVHLHPAPDAWDRQYNVDFFIPLGERCIGIQIKPITYHQAPEAYRWREWMQDSHERFAQDKGGRVFIVFSVTEQGGRKRIWNAEVIEDIRREIERLTGGK